MNTISQYKYFLNEADGPYGDEKPKFIKEKKLMKLFLSPQLETILQKILKSGDFQCKAIANRMLTDEQRPNDLYDISYLDIDKDKDDTITFMPAQQAWSKMEFIDQSQANQKPTPDCPMWNGPGRQPLRVGGLINRLFVDDGEPIFKEQAVAKFINIYKAELAGILIYNRFKIVRGEDVRYWYAESNLSPNVAGSRLHGSCMRHDGTGGNGNCQPYFNIYVENPDHCGLLILTNQYNKLIGRALVWGGENEKNRLRKPIGGRIFMDRIYTTKDSEIDLFKKYAKEKGWIYKYSQEAQNASYIDPLNNDEHVNKSISIQLTPGEHKQYPYMDTLKYYNPFTGRLASDPGNPPSEDLKRMGSKRWKLECTNGIPDLLDKK